MEIITSGIRRVVDRIQSVREERRTKETRKTKVVVFPPLKKSSDVLTPELARQLNDRAGASLPDETTLKDLVPRGEYDRRRQVIHEPEQWFREYYSLEPIERAQVTASITNPLREGIKTIGVIRDLEQEQLAAIGNMGDLRAAFILTVFQEKPQESAVRKLLTQRRFF